MKMIKFASLLILIVMVSCLSRASYAQDHKMAPAHNRRDFIVLGDGVEGDSLWLASPKTRKKIAILPLPKSYAATFPLYSVAVSPDERIIICDSKLVVGQNAVFVYREASKYHYKPIDADLNDKAMRFYSRKIHQEIPYALFRFVRWSRGSRLVHFRLVGDHGKTITQGTFDTATEKFL